jgi:LysR family nitrogen assimilation transcriptional regulator
MDLKLLRRVGLEIKCLPAILDLVQRHPLHAVLSLDALRGAEREAAYAARQIVTARNRKPLTASLWVDHISAAPARPVAAAGPAPCCVCSLLVERPAGRP